MINVSARDDELRPSLHRVAAGRLAHAALGGGRRVLHGLDVRVLGLLLEVVARVTERKLLRLAELPSPDVAASGQRSSSAKPTTP